MISSQLTKLLQSRASFSMLVRGKEDSKYQVIRGDCSTALQWVERTTAECLLEGRCLRSNRSKDVESFGDKVFLSTLDGASSNNRYISHVHDGLENWTDFTMLCEDHIIFNLLNDVAKLCDFDISGQVHWALSMQHAMARVYTRKILHQDCDDWVQVCRAK